MGMNEFSGKLPAPITKNTAVTRKVLNVNKKLNMQRTRTWPRIAIRDGPHQQVCMMTFKLQKNVPYDGPYHDTCSNIQI